MEVSKKILWQKGMNLHFDIFIYKVSEVQMKKKICMSI